MIPEKPKSRWIELRRPPSLAILPEPFVPDLSSGQQDEVENRWAELCAANPRYHDGRMYQVLGVHRNGAGGATLHLAECAYRFFAVQDHTFDLGIRPLGVKGMVRNSTGSLLFGRRSNQVASYQETWELAPGGVVEPGEDPAETLIRELREETGLCTTLPPIARAVVSDPNLRCWELVYTCAAVEGDLHPVDGEYTQLAWNIVNELPGPLTPIARTILRSMA